MFPPDQPTPARLARAQLATWLRATGVVDGVVPLADSLVGAAEARGFLRWIGAQMVDPTPDEAWALALAQLALAQREPTPR